MYWLIGAVVLVVLEIFVGTFYLLFMAAAAASVGLTQWLFGTSAAFNVGFFAVLSAIGIVLARRFQKNRAIRQKNTNQALDIGQTVTIEKHLHHNQYQVKYRGTTWQAELTDGSATSGQTAYIYNRNGNLLLIQIQPLL